MHLPRRSLLGLFAASSAWAQSFPERPVRLVVPRAPGGGSDNLARVFAGPLGLRLGQSVVIENKPDATAVLGAELVAHARADGHTLYLADNSFYQNPAVIGALPYDTLRDFSGVTMLAEAPVVLLLNPAVPARNLAELVAYAKANPGKLSYASGGVGASTHLAGVQFNLAAGIETLHVPFRSSGPAVTALLSRQVDMQYGGMSSARQLIETGQVRAVAVTGGRREPAIPDVPTFAQAGFAGVDITSIWGLHAPAATPMGPRRAMRDAIAATFAEPEVAARLSQLGFTPLVTTPEAHQRATEELVARWIEIGKRVNLKE